MSFTEDRNRAERYSLGRDSGAKLERSTGAREDALLFTLNVDGMRNDGHDGVFVLDYTCDYAQVWPYPASGDPESLDYISQASTGRCEFCDPSNVVTAEEERVGGDGRRLHRIRLIRVAQFLRSGALRDRYFQATQQAERDREWLVYPMDYVHRLRGYAARMPPSRIWTVERFVVALPQ